MKSQANMDRVKVLKGNSTAPSCEEVSEGNGKRNIALLQRRSSGWEALQTLLAMGGGGNHSPSSACTPASNSNNPATPEASLGHLAISIDLSALSARGKDFLTGKRSSSVIF